MFRERSDGATGRHNWFGSGDGGDKGVIKERVGRDGDKSIVFFFKQKTAYAILSGLVDSEMCIEGRAYVRDL